MFIGLGIYLAARLEGVSSNMRALGPESREHKLEI